MPADQEILSLAKIFIRHAKSHCEISEMSAMISLSTNDVPPGDDGSSGRVGGSSAIPETE
jgi:hypothetical protein